ncbi:MAG: LmeA family phospholipid-binding protein, partial [Synechococcaceae cyanobacterium RM1_1_27]|nr:LmeA family phospholipid-binding protein [Synechococcaceae cyanobacterium RM1_1_27]
ADRGVGAVFPGGVYRLQRDLSGPGQIAPAHPIRMRVVLTEEDLSTSFNTPFVMRQMQKLQINGQPLELRNVTVSISNEGRLRIQSEVKGGDEWQPMDFSTVVEVKDRHCIRFEDVIYDESVADHRMAEALVEHVNRILDLDTFSLDGTQLRIDQVRVRDQKVVFYGSARIDQFPRRNG